jgi:hypothetical protein
MYFDFPCHYFFIMIAPETSLPSTSQAWYNRPISDCSSSGLGSALVP